MSASILVNSPKSRLMLASSSPRRRDLLGKMGYVFDTCKPDVDENMTGDASEIVLELARRKARWAAQKYPDRVILASDTLVSIDGVPLGKPRDEYDARNMLRHLSGRSHEVYSGVCVIVPGGHEDTRSECTKVKFKELSPDEIDSYIASGEPMDKAGAYGIQGGAASFVEKLEGSYENVMGFPVELVKKMLVGISF